MADEKKVGCDIAGISDQAKAILAEVHDDIIKVGGEVKTLAVSVEQAVVCTGKQAAEALSEVITKMWATLKLRK